MIADYYTLLKDFVKDTKNPPFGRSSVYVKNLYGLMYKHSRPW